MAQITLGNKKTIKTLKVCIGEDTYNVPLAGSLTFAEVKKLQNDENGLNFFENYIPREVLDELTVDDFKRLNETWKEESGITSSVEVGE